MLSTNDIRIVYLEFLHREPSNDEVLNAQNYISSITDLETYIQNLAEYTTLFLNPAKFSFTIDDDDVVNVDRVNASLKDNQVIGNNTVSFTVSGKGVEQIYYYDNESIQHQVSNFMNPLLKLSNNDNYLNTSNKSLHLHTKECYFTEHRTYYDLNQLQVQINKYPLYNFKSCVLQKISLTHSQNDAINVNISYKLNTVAVNDFNYGTLSFHDSKYLPYYELYDKQSLINILTVSESSNGSYKFKEIVNDSSDGCTKAIYDVMLEPNVETVIYFLTAISYNDRYINRKIIETTLIHSYNDLISNHVSLWQNMAWNRLINIIPKSSIDSFHLEHITEFNASNKLCLFNLVCDPFLTKIDIDLYGLPILILVNPESALQLLNKRSNHINFANQVILYDNFTTIFDKKKECYFYVKISLLCIHHWNYFRVSKNKNWLINTSIPFFQNCLSHLKFYEFDSNDTLENYIIEQAIYFIQQAFYEADYKNHTIYASKYSIPFFDYTTLVKPIDENITIKVELIDEIMHYVLYNTSDDSLLGYRFGGSSGFKLALEPDTIYSFKLDFDMQKYPIRFRVVNDEIGARFNILGLVYDNIDQYDSFIDPPPNEFNVSSNRILGYEFFIDETDVYAMIKNSVNMHYGYLAFYTTVTTLTNIVKPLQDYQLEVLDKIHTYLMFSSYYSSTFFREKSKSELFEYKKTYTDIVKDNIVFYNKHRRKSDSLTNILEASLQCMVAPFVDTYKQKHNSMTILYSNLINTVKDNTFNKHWFIGKYSYEVLFMFLTYIAELSPCGEVQKDRVATIEYQLLYQDKNVLPIFWKSISLTNVGIQRKNINIINQLYFEDPYLNFPQLTEYTVSHNANQHSVKISLDFKHSFPNGVPDTFQFYFYLQHISDTTNYTVESVNALSLQILLDQAMNDSIVNQAYIDIPYDAILNNVVSDVTLDIDILRNRVCHFIYNINATTKTYHFKSFVLQNLQSVVTNQSGIVTSILEYKKPLTLEFNTSYNSLYNSFSNVHLSFNYDNLYFNYITHETSNILDYTDITHNQTTSNYTMSLTTTSNIVSSVYDLGIFELDINYNAINNNYTTSLETVFNSENILVTNKEIFPPKVKIIQIPSEFKDNLTVIEALYTSDELEGTFVYPIKRVTPFYPDPALTFINQLLSEENNTLINVLSTPLNSIFIIKTVDDVLLYYGVGFNEHNVLMTNRTENYLETPQLCEIITSNFLGNPILDIYFSSKFSIVRALNNKLYAIGNNECFNLGDHTNFNRSTFVESVALNTLIQTNNSNFRDLILNDLGVILWLSDRTLYVLGKMDPLFDTTILKPFSIINSFLETNDYNIVKIYNGKGHLKFLLEKDGSMEWWGIGQNTYHSMGIDNKVDNDFVVNEMHRLHEIEKLIHGTSYDIYYTGLSVSNSDKYHFVSTHNLPASCTLVLDETNNTMYQLGTFDENTVFKEWTIVDTSIISGSSKFLSLYRESFIIGDVIDLLTVFDNMYIRIYDDVLLNAFYNTSNFPILIHIDAQNVDGFTVTDIIPTNTEHLVYRDEFGNRENILYVDNVYDLSKNTIAPHSTKFIGRAILSGNDTNWINYDEGFKSEVLTTTPMILGKIGPHNSFLGYLQFGKKFVTPDWADDFEQSKTYMGFYEDGDVMKYNYETQNINDFTIVMVYSMKNLSKGTWVPYYAWMPSYTGISLLQYDKQTGLSQSVANWWNDIRNVNLPNQHSLDPVIIIQRIKYIDDSNIKAHFKFTNARTKSIILDAEYVFQKGNTFSYLDWQGGPLSIRHDIFGHFDNNRFDGSEFNIGEFILYNTWLDNALVDRLNNLLISKWYDEDYEKPIKEQHKGYVLDDFYNNKHFEIMLHVDASNENGYTKDANDHITSIFDLSKNVKAPHATTRIGQITNEDTTGNLPMVLSTININPAFNGFAQFGAPLSNDKKLPLYETFDVMTKNNYHNYTVMTVCQFDDFASGQWSPILTYYKSNGLRGIFLGKRETTTEIISAFGGKQDDVFKIMDNVLGKPILYVQRFKNNSTLDNNFDYYFKAVDLITGNVLIDVHKTIIDQVQDMFNDYGGHLIIGTDESNNTLNAFKFGEILFYNEFLNDSNIDTLTTLLFNKWNPPPNIQYELYNRSIIPTILIHIDAQNTNGFTATTTLPANTLNSLYRDEFGNRRNIVYIDNVYDLSKNVIAPHSAKYLGRSLILSNDPDYLNYDDDNDEILTLTPLLLSNINGYNAFEGFIQFGNKFIKQNGADDSVEDLPTQLYYGSYEQRDVMKYQHEYLTYRDFTIAVVFSVKNPGKIWWIPIYAYMPDDVGIALNLNNADLAVHTGSGATKIMNFLTNEMSQEPLLLIHRIKYFSHSQINVKYKVIKINTGEVVVNEDVDGVTSNDPSIFDKWQGGPFYIGSDEWSRQNDSWMYSGTELKVGEFIMYNEWFNDEYISQLENKLLTKWNNKDYHNPIKQQYNANTLEDFYNTNNFDIMLHVDALNEDGYALDINKNVTHIYDLSKNVKSPHASTKLGFNIINLQTQEPSPMSLSSINHNRAFEGFVEFGVRWSNNKRFPLYENFDVMTKNNNHNYTIVTVCQFDGFDSDLAKVTSPIFIFINHPHQLRGIYLGRKSFGTEIISSVGGRFNDSMKINSENLFGKPIMYIQRFKNNTNMDNNFDYHLKAVDLLTGKIIFDESTTITDQLQDMFNDYGGNVMIGTDEYNNKLNGFKFGEVLFYNEFLSDDNSDKLTKLLFNKWKPAFYKTEKYDIMIHVDAQNTEGYTMNGDEVTNVYDLSQNVRSPHSSTLVGHTVLSTNPFTVTPLKLTTINGYTGFDGFIQFGKQNLSSITGNYNNYDVMKKNDSESYTIVTLCSFTELGGVWANLVNFFQANGNRGLNITRWGGNNYLVMAGGIKTDVETLQLPNVMPQYSDVPLLYIQRYENLTNGTSNNNFTYHFKVIDFRNNSVLLDVNANVTDQFPNVFNSIGSHFFLGADEFIYSFGEGQRVKGYKVGESIMYNQFLTNEEIESLTNILYKKWSS